MFVCRYLEGLASFELDFKRLHRDFEGNGLNFIDVAEKARMFAGSIAMFGHPEIVRPQHE